MNPGQSLSASARLGALLVLALGVRLLFLGGYVGGDDAAYIAHAYAYAQGDYTVPYSHWGIRSGVTWPTAFAFRWLGVNTVSIVLWPLLLSLVGVLLAYRLGAELFDDATGLLAALFAAVFPSEVMNATQLFPSAWLSTFTTACLLALVLAARRGQAALAALAGVLLGGAYLSNITGLFALLAVALLGLYLRPAPRLVLAFVAGLGLVVTLEALYGVWQSGDPLQRLTVNIAMTAARDSSEAIKFEFGPTWLAEPFYRPLTEQEIGPWWLLMLVAAGYGLLRRRERGYAILLLWTLPIFLYISYGTMSPFSYSMLRRLPRYLAPVDLPWLVLTAAFVRAWSWHALRRLAVVLLCLGSALLLWLDNSPYDMVLPRMVAQFIDEHPGERMQLARPLYLDVAIVRGLAPDPRLSVYARAGDASHELRRIHIVHPDVPVSERPSAEGARYVLLEGEYLAEEVVAALPGAERVAILVEPKRLYHRLIEHPWVQAILRHVRDASRYSSLVHGGTEGVVIYRLGGR